MTRRLLAALTTTVLSATGLALVAAAPAQAQLRTGIKVVEGQVVEKEYPPIPGSYPVAPTVNWTPGGCNNAAVGNVCDTVPIEIVVPKLGPVDDFFVTIAVSWPDPTGENDIDIYLWDDEQVKKAKGSSGWTEQSRSAGSSNPEVIKQFAPTLGKYNLTVVNWVGPNLGYKVRAFITKVEFDPPFELLAPDLRPPSDSSGKNDTVAPVDYSATPPPGASGGPIAPSFGEVPIEPDASLDFGPSDFAQAIAAPPQIRTGVQANRRPPRPVPGAVAAFWLGGVPLVLTGAAVLVLARRRRESFAFA